MSMGVVRGVLALAVTLGLAACGSQPPAGNARVGATESAASPAFVARARQVVAQWRVAPAERAWNSGMVLLGPGELTPVPRDAGFASQYQKGAFASGRFRLAGALPGQALHGRIRWADGITRAVPLLSAQAAFRQLAVNRACGVPPCGRLTVTAARPGTVTIDTSRGPAVVPAWRFTVAELNWTVTEAAVAAGSLVTLPSAYPWPAAGQGTPGVAGLTAVSADGRTLTVQFLTGACDTAWGVHLYQTGSAVVVGSWSGGGNGQGACPASALSRSARVTLAHPLGSRVVLDVASGQPLAPGGPALG
ncbi:MAG: hypothetical protein ABSB76_00840 [Streptosporangiaceae bacterium]